MRKTILVAITTAFVAGALAAPVLAAKAKPGMCGTYMFFDKKTKACKDKRG